MGQVESAEAKEEKGAAFLVDTVLCVEWLLWLFTHLPSLPTLPPNVWPAKQQRQRREVVQEIVSTEHSYVAGLQVCMEVFMRPLEQVSYCTSHLCSFFLHILAFPYFFFFCCCCCSQAVEQGRPIIKEQDIRTIFSVVKLLHQIHMPFAAELKQLLDKYNDKKPFAHVFINHVHAFPELVAGRR